MSCLGVAVSVLLVLGAEGCARSGPQGRPGNPKVVVLGFAGLDAGVVRELLDAHAMPELERIVAQGTFRALTPLAATDPAARWSSFATSRDRGSSAASDLTLEPPVLFAGFLLRGPRAHASRPEESFWETADRRGKTVVGLALPYEFPPARLTHGRTLSGIGVPDLPGGDRFTYLTTAEPPSGPGACSRDDANACAPDEGGGGGASAEESIAPRDGTVVHLGWRGGRIETALGGPQLPGRAPLELPLSIRRRPEGGVLLELGGDDRVLLPGEWSDWFRVRFPVTHGYGISAICRFYLVRDAPDLGLYLSPLSYDPSAPYIPISSPEGFSASLAGALGEFGSSGWTAEDAAFRAGLLPELGLVEELTGRMRFSRALTLHEIDLRDAELVVSVFSATEGLGRAFSGDDEASREVMHRTYLAVDQIVGDVARHLPDGARLIVFSDRAASASSGRGFLGTSFRLRDGDASLLDIAPTVLTLLGVAAPPSYEGHALD